MKAFYSIADKGPGLSQKACFALVKRLLARNEGRSLAVEDRMRVLRGIQMHRGRGPHAKTYCLVVTDRACLDNATGPMWDNLLKELGAASKETIPLGFEDEPFCGGDSLHRLASPAPGAGGEVRHLMLESRRGRFEALLEEVTHVDGARAAIVTMDSAAKGPMTCVMLEFGKDGVPGGALESLFPSAEVIRVSDDPRRLVFTHLGSSCRWMFDAENDVVLVPVLAREHPDENKALVTFRGDDGSLEAVLCGWNRDDESGLGSFIKLSLNTPDKPLLPEASSGVLADGAVDMPVWLAREDRPPAEDRRIYVISDTAPLFFKALSRIVDAAELSGQGNLSFARWTEPATGACSYAFRSEFIGELESFRDVRAYRILEAQLDGCGLAVRQGYRFVPEMPDDEGWGSAVKSALFDASGMVGAGWALVDPCAQGDDGLSGVSAVIIPEFKSFEGYRKHVAVFGPVVRAELVADEKSRHLEFSAQAEAAWNQAAEAEKATHDANAQRLFEELADGARRLDQSLRAMDDEVRSTTDMAATLHAEAKQSRDDLAETAVAFTEAMRGAAVRSANWSRLQKSLQEHVRLLESYARMLDGAVRSNAQAELARGKAQEEVLLRRLQELGQSEAEVAAAHVKSAELVSRLEGEAARVEAEIERLGDTVSQDAERVAYFDSLTAKMAALADLRHAKETQSLNVRHAYAQCEIREQEVRDELLSLEKSLVGLAEKKRLVAEQSAEITRRREAIRTSGVDVRNAESERDNLTRALGREEKALADMIKGGDPRQLARGLLDKAKAVRADIDEVNEARLLLTDGDAEIGKLEAELDGLLKGDSVDGLRANVKGTEAAVLILERAIHSLEEALAGEDIMRANPIAADKLRSWDQFRSEASRRLAAARVTYLRCRNPMESPLVAEINAAIDALNQLL
jgi:hypothetical protein